MSNYIETAFMQQRTDFMKTLPDRRKRFSIPDGVDMYLDIEYVNDQNEAHRLDVFEPFLPESTQTIQAIAEYFAEIHEQ